MLASSIRTQLPLEGQLLRFYLYRAAADRWGVPAMLLALAAGSAVLTGAILAVWRPGRPGALRADTSLPHTGP